MRRISKAWPPKEMVDAEREFLKELPTKAEPEKFARMTFDALDKQTLRQTLFTEQHHICIYCEQRVGEDAKANRQPPIDHWHPLSHQPELALHWKNLHVCCTRRDTCDGSKHDHRFVWNDDAPALPWPSDVHYEECIGFTKDGRAYVRTDAPLDEAQRKALALAIDDCEDGARNQKAILNLNDRVLVAARQAAMDGERKRIEDAFKKATATLTDREALAKKLLAQKIYEPFISVRIAWLRKLLGKNKPVAQTEAPPCA